MTTGINDTGIIPVGFNVLLEIPKQQEKTKGGIIIPDQKTSTLLKCLGRVLAMGSDAFTNVYGEVIPEKPKVGDYVYIPRHSGKDIHLEDKFLRMVSSDEIRAVLTEEGTKKFKEKVK